MKPPVHLISASNAGYSMPLSVMLVSVVENFDPERELVIHLICSEATAQMRDNVVESIRNVRPGLEHIDVRWYSLDEAQLKDLPLPEGSYYSRDCYVRLFAPHLLPESCERAIYLDCDLVTLTDISKLYDSTANDPTVISAAPDIWCPRVSSPKGVFDYAERGIAPDAPCFNGGVLVIHLKRWRERKLTEQLVEYLVRHGGRVHFVDQGAMNALLHKDWTPLDIRWNQPHVVLFPEEWIALGFTLQDWRHAINNPHIVHFMGPEKPWLPEYRNLPRRAWFFQYLQKTVFKNTVPGFPYLESILGFRTYHYLWRAKMKLFPNGLTRPFNRRRETAQLALA